MLVPPPPALLIASSRQMELCGVPTDPTRHNCVIFESMKSERAGLFEPHGVIDLLKTIRRQGESYSEVILRLAAEK
jgi:hypothetical protein